MKVEIKRTKVVQREWENDDGVMELNDYDETDTIIVHEKSIKIIPDGWNTGNHFSYDEVFDALIKLFNSKQ